MIHSSHSSPISSTIKLYISRSGTLEGPYSRDKVADMLKLGKLAPTDLGAPPGADDWAPLSELFAQPATTPPPLPTSTPPPLPEQTPPFDQNQPFMIDGQISPGTEGMSTREVLDGVAAGGRLVVFSYVYSVLIMTFRKTTPIHYIAPGKSAAGQAFKWSLIPLFLGWWGFPWGIIYTPAALWRNTGGGVDVSEAILATFLSPEKADAMIRQRPAAPRGMLMGLRALFLSPLVILPLLVAAMIASSAADEEQRKKQHGYTDFKQAERVVARPKAYHGLGNTSTATDAAGIFSTFIDEFCTHNIVNEDADDGDSAADDIGTWCEVHGNRCLFMMRVPGLRQFTDDAKDSLAEAAWIAAQLSADTLELGEDAELAVAIRGKLLYDRVITGRHLQDFNYDSPDAENLLKASILKTRKGNSVDDLLIRYFAKPKAEKSE